MEQYCPNCVKQLSPQSKKLGEFSRWFVCPSCGHRERPITDETKEAQKFIARKSSQTKTLTNLTMTCKKIKKDSEIDNIGFVRFSNGKIVKFIYRPLNKQ